MFFHPFPFRGIQGGRFEKDSVRHYDLPNIMQESSDPAADLFGVVLGDVGKFIWDHKKEIGAGLGGMFFLGQMLLAKVIGFLGSAAWTLGGALTGGIIGFMVGGPVGAAIGTLAGGTIGYLISSGAIG